MLSFMDFIKCEFVTDPAQADIVVPSTPEKDNYLDRNDAVKAIRAAFKARGLRYSVVGGRGTAWGWITIGVLPSEVRGKNRDEVAALYRKLGEDLGERMTCGGNIGVPASSEYRREYLDRASGRTPSVKGTPYWD